MAGSHHQGLAEEETAAAIHTRQRIPTEHFLLRVLQRLIYNTAMPPESASGQRFMGTAHASTSPQGFNGARVTHTPRINTATFVQKV